MDAQPKPHYMHSYPTISELQAEVAQLKLTNADLEAENAELEAQLTKACKRIKFLEIALGPGPSVNPEDQCPSGS